MARGPTLGVALSLVIAGCGDDGTATVDAAATDDGAGADGAAVDAPPDAPPPRRSRGTVAAVRLPFPDARLQLVAGFVRIPDGAPGCTTTTSGDCTRTTCPTDVGAVAASAGDVTFTVNTQTFVLMPNDQGTYDQQLTQMVTPGVAIGISAAGAEVPAFATSQLRELPEALVRTSPPDVATFDRAQDLVITWTAATGTAYVGIGQSRIEAPYPIYYRTAISCDFPASAGSGTIPAALLSALEPGPVNANLAVIDSSTVTAGDFDVQLAVGTASKAWTSFTAQ